LKKKTEKLRTIGLIANFDKPASRAVVLRAAALIARTGVVVVAEQQTARMAGLRCATFPDAAALARQAGLLLVFGGDGTMLRVVHEIHGLQTPILGINVGRLGFLTAVSSNDLPAALQKIWQKDYVIESRPLIEAGGRCQEKPIQMSAFNDIVISHGAVSRVIELDVYVDDQPLTRYRGDGLIVSSPTGSTAYSLSAGGPIISPEARVFAITPICAHAVSNRSVIISSNSTVRVKLLSREMETIIAADGQLQATLGADDAITIRRSRRSARLLHLGDSSFFAAVRKKLHWSGSSV
jgi:NAD+ kinase